MTHDVRIEPIARFPLRHDRLLAQLAGDLVEQHAWLMRRSERVRAVLRRHQSRIPEVKAEYARARAVVDEKLTPAKARAVVVARLRELIALADALKRREVRLFRATVTLEQRLARFNAECAHYAAAESSSSLSFIPRSVEA